MEQIFGYNSDVLIRIIEGSKELLIGFDVSVIPPHKVTCEQKERISALRQFVFIGFRISLYKVRHSLLSRQF